MGSRNGTGKGKERDRENSGKRPLGSRLIAWEERALVSVGEWPLHMAVKFLAVSLPKLTKN